MYVMPWFLPKKYFLISQYIHLGSNLSRRYKRALTKELSLNCYYIDKVYHSKEKKSLQDKYLLTGDAVLYKRALV